MGNGTGEDTDTSVDSAPSSARPPRPRVHPRTASRSPSSAQSMANSNASSGGSRMTTRRLLGHSRALSIDRGAAAGALPHTKPRSSTTTTTPTTPASASATAGFWDPPVMRQEETEARSKAARPPPKVIAGKPRAPVAVASWWLISIRADFSFSFLLLLFCLVGFYFFEGLRLQSFPPSLSTAFSSFDHIARFSRVCVRACTQWKLDSIVLYDVLQSILFLTTSTFISSFGN